VGQPKASRVLEDKPVEVGRGRKHKEKLEELADGAGEE